MLEIIAIIGIPEIFYYGGVRLFDCLCIYRIDGQNSKSWTGKVLKACGFGNYLSYGDWFGLNQPWFRLDLLWLMIILRRPHHCC